MSQIITGFFRTRGEGEAAQNELFAKGFSRDEVSFVAGETSPHEIPAIGPIQSVGAESVAASDAFVGGMVGLAASMAAIFIPGIGPLVAAGPLAAAIGGLAAGTAAGGVIGLLRDYGVSEEEARFYAEGVKRGGALVAVHGVDDDRAKLAREIFDHGDAVAVETEKEESHA